MKIGPEHVGKLIGDSQGRAYRVRFVGEKYFFADRDPDGEGSWPRDHRDWCEVEEPKKPSERIEEIERGLEDGPGKLSSRLIIATIQYLDDLHEQGKLK